jgi:exopolysaccharide biosynthesis WecB/TagA/CpsF family protein
MGNSRSRSRSRFRRSSSRGGSCGEIRISVNPLHKFILDDYNLDEFVAILANWRESSFEYVVTPNIDHIIRYCDDASFRELYANARFRLNDSRLLARILSITRGLKPRVCPGSDLTVALFSILEPEDRVVIIGSTPETARQLAEKYRLRNIHCYSPPMGFIRDPAAVEKTLEFLEAHSPFRFCLLAVGSPQQEHLANELRRRGRAQGIGLCVGASIDFLTGLERRAPRWMQRLALEWLYRLMQNPRRLGRRYLVRGPRIFRLVPRIEFELRRIRGASA